MEDFFCQKSEVVFNFLYFNCIKHQKMYDYLVPDAYCDELEGIIGY